MTAPEPRHVPVLLERCVALLAPAVTVRGAVMVDATLGLGGHSETMLRRFPHLRLVGIDRDPEALGLSKGRLAPFADRTTLVHAVYDELPDVLARLGLASVQGVLFDLGLSSLQIDHTARGFSYSANAPLDMRMDQTAGRTAADVVNTYPAEELARVLRDYGEERFARRIADRLVLEREGRPFTMTAPLAELVRNAVPAATRRTGGHPAKRTFQALRIEVNGELASLERALPAAIDALSLGGRLVVMSYQSLEDRLVKRALARAASPSAPPDLPVVPPTMAPRLRLLTRGAETASAAEVAANPRAASVRLRAAECVRVAA
jgi:16S rRNA (cytosine1402-N4)-methyltransferase